ncbi:hypothetical protein ACWCQK_33215 [Streptomyces sp. NPDC002306]
MHPDQATLRRQLKRTPARGQEDPEPDPLHEIPSRVGDGDPDSAARLLSEERSYPIEDGLLAHIRG